MDKDFKELFNKLNYGKTPRTVWDDFICMSAIAISNAVDFNEAREAEYLSIAKKYKPEELTLVAKMFAGVAMALERNPCQDYLGAMFMELNFGNARTGQYFTPYHIAELMSMLTITEQTDKYFQTINDPTCGSGVMLIAALNTLRRNKPKMSSSIFVVGQDIELTIALMCYIQISLLGVAGYVVVGDSLSQPLSGDTLFAPKGAWVTPVYHDVAWTGRRMLRLISGKRL